MPIKVGKEKYKSFDIAAAAVAKKNGISSVLSSFVSSTTESYSRTTTTKVPITSRKFSF